VVESAMNNDRSAGMAIGALPPGVMANESRRAGSRGIGSAGTGSRAMSNFSAASHYSPAWTAAGTLGMARLASQISAMTTAP
jgi:hypothetical protein